MLRFGKIKVAKEEFYGATNKNLGYWFDNIVVSKLVKPKNNYKYLIGV